MTETVVLHFDPLASTITTKWGEITQSTPKKIPGKPGHVTVGTQCLAMAYFIKELLDTAEPIYANDCICSASRDGDRLFFHAQAENGNWTWLMHPAYFDDGGGPDGLMLGVFPD